MRKNCSSDREKTFEAEGRELAKFLRSLEQSILAVKCQNNFGNRMLFELVPGGFPCLINYNSSWKKLFGFRNMQEKLEN